MRGPSGGVELRPLADIFEESVDTLRQELSEYSFIALVGAVTAGLIVLVCGVVDTSVSLALIGPLVLLAAVLTLATCAAAFGCVSNNMQPDAGAAALAMLGKLPALLLTWLPPAVALGVVSFAMAEFATEIDKAYIPDSVQVLALIAAAFWYAYPRSLSVAAVFEPELSSHQASQLSAFIVRNSGMRIWALWIIVLAPAALMMALSLVVTLDIVTGALVTCFFVGAMPMAAALMSLLFYDAASQIELAPTPAATAHRLRA